MSRVKNLWGIVIFLLLTVVAIGFADYDEKHGHDKHDKHEKMQKNERNKESEHDREDYLKPINNAVYKEKCETCHFAYQPELLVSKGWKQILEQPDNHFGESIDFSTEEKKEIENYLLANAAEKSNSEISRKIIKSLGGQIAARITEIPYITKQHRKIDQDVLKRNSIGSLSKCSACHKKAEEGCYDDDFVIIPQ